MTSVDSGAVSISVATGRVGTSPHAGSIDSNDTIISMNRPAFHRDSKKLGAVHGPDCWQALTSDAG